MNYSFDVVFYRIGGRDFSYYIATPAVSFTVDRQMEERFIATDGSFHGGYVEYILSVGWLVWEFSIVMTASRYKRYERGL